MELEGFQLKKIIIMVGYEFPKYSKMLSEYELL